MVRKDVDLNSAPVSVLPAGTFVWVEEAQGRRVRVAHPVDGWSSLRTADGLVILQRDGSRSHQHHMSEVDALLMKDKNFLSATQRLKDVQGKLNEARDRLGSTLDRLKSQELTKQVTGKATEVIAEVPALEQQAVAGAHQAVTKVVKPQGVKNFLEGLLRQPGVQHIVEGAEDAATSTAEHAAAGMAGAGAGDGLERAVKAQAEAGGQQLAQAADDALD